VPVIDDADVDRMVGVFVEHGLLDPVLAYKIALISQARMTTGYAKEFARKVRQRIQWAESRNGRLPFLRPPFLRVSV
jgi:hypothetical protein